MERGELDTRQADGLVDGWMDEDRTGPPNGCVWKGNWSERKGSFRRMSSERKLYDGIIKSHLMMNSRLRSS